MATLGVLVTSAQIARLARYPVRVVCFDNEAGAQRRALALCRELSVFAGTTQNVVLDAADPGSAPPAETRALRRLIEEPNVDQRCAGIGA